MAAPQPMGLKFGRTMRRSALSPQSDVRCDGARDEAAAEDAAEVSGVVANAGLSARDAFFRGFEPDSRRTIMPAEMGGDGWPR